MNILQVIPELNVGGVETGTIDFAHYLAKHGHTAVVVSNGGELVELLEKQGGRHYTLPVHEKSLRTMWQSVRKLRKIIQDENIDIVHARSRVPAWISYFACRHTKAEFITTCHGYYNNRVFSQVMGWSKLVIVPSNVIARHMIDRFKVMPRSIRCIPRSVNLGKFKIKQKSSRINNQCTITIIGRLTPLKGHGYFLKAMARVLRNAPYAQIWIVGDAPAQKQSYKQELQMLARRLGIAERVEFLGSRQDIPDILAKTDILVLSTITQEAFGRVIIEAQASGVPVVATNVGGVVDIVDDGETGLLVPSKDSQAMALAVMRLMNDQKLSDHLVTQAQKKLKANYTLDHMASQTLNVYEELKNSLNILVIKIGSIGDVILVTAALKALRRKFPHAKIHCLVGAESRKVLHNCPYVDGIIVYDHLGKDKGWLRLIRFSKKLRKYRFDKIIDFQNNRKSHALAFLSFPRESYGYKNKKWGTLLTHGIKDGGEPIPPVNHQFKVLEGVGIYYKSGSYLELWPSSKDKEYIQSLLESEWLGNDDHIIGINLTASAKWPTKNWPIEYIAETCDLLSARNIRVIITGMNKDKSLAQYLLTLTKSKPANFVGKTDALQLAALIKKCKVYITPDSAPLHIAAAVQTPVIAFFGPTDSRRHIPPARKIIVLERKLACAPCYSTRCRIFTHACMRDIQPVDVIHEVDSLIGERV